MNEATRVCILGAGGSGLAAARLLSLRDGVKGRVCSEKEPGRDTVEAFDTLGFAWDSTGPRGGDSLVVVSPGFAADHAWIVRARGFGTRVQAEAELGAERLQGRVLAITGSLGKTTMAMLAAEVLKAHGFSVTLSGNIGVPVCEAALETPEADWHVMELSSFQTEIFESFRADVGVILNLMPNHLDRHGTMEGYATAKARMLAFQVPGDVAVIPADYPVAVTTQGRVGIPEVSRIPDTRGTGFNLPAYRANLAALMTGLAEVCLDSGKVRSVLERFTFPPHRMQVLEHRLGGLIVDDSKSTCLSATRAAIEAVGETAVGGKAVGETAVGGRAVGGKVMTGTMHVMMGGVHKGDSPELLREVLASYPVSLYVFGASAEVFDGSWRGQADRCEVFETLDEAVEAVFLCRKDGEPLLFSPGCASFDHYSSYMERGQHFQHLIEHYSTYKIHSSMPVQEKP